MKKREKIRNLLVLLLLVAGLAACSEDNTGLLLNGTWHVEENSQLYGTQHYDVDITQIDTVKIEISNFYNIGESSFVTASVNGLEIALQDQQAGGYLFSGSGEISGDHNTIIFTFTANDGAVIDHVIAQYTR
jgi:hypothetical protein